MDIIALFADWWPSAVAYCLFFVCCRSRRCHFLVSILEDSLGLRRSMRYAVEPSHFISISFQSHFNRVTTSDPVLTSFLCSISNHLTLLPDSRLETGLVIALRQPQQRTDTSLTSESDAVRCSFV